MSKNTLIAKQKSACGSIAAAKNKNRNSKELQNEVETNDQMYAANDPNIGENLVESILSVSRGIENRNLNIDKVNFLIILCESIH